MTKQQRHWASQHDWFIREDDDGVIVMDYVLEDGRTFRQEQRRFRDFKALQIWAGYQS